MSQTLTPQEIAALRTAINLIETKAGRIEINSDRLEQFINNPTGTITTDGGEVKTIGQAIIDAVAAFNAGTGGTASQAISDINAILSQIRGGADLSTTNLEILRDDVGNSGDPAADTGSLNARDAKRKEDIEAIKGTNYQESTTLSSLQTALNTLSGLVGSRPSLTYYYFASATASALSSANANTQAVWTWLNRIFTSIRNLDSKITAIKGTGYQTSTTLSSLQQAINSGGGGGGGTPGANGLPGRQMGVFFRESATEPADPVVGEDTSEGYVKVATPSGWSTARPANPTQKLWMLVQQGQGNVANNAFTETFSSGPIDISPGANGLAGRVWRFFFRRSATAIAAPSVTPYVTAGRVDIQTPSGWSTSIPAGTETLRMLAQSTQPNAANDGGHHSLSFIIPLPQPAAGGGGGGISQQTFDELANAVGASSDAEDIDGTTLWNQFNQVKEWLGSPSGNLSYYADQNTDSISAATAASQSVWVWLTRFSFSIRNLKNRLGALLGSLGSSGDDADIDGTGLWAQFKKIKEMVLNRALPREIFAYYMDFSAGEPDAPTSSQVSVNTSTGALTYSSISPAGGWSKELPRNATTAVGGGGWRIYRARAILSFSETGGYSIGNWTVEKFAPYAEDPAINAAAISAIQTQLANLPDASGGTRPPRYLDTTADLEGETEFNGESLADLGFQGGDTAITESPKIYRVVATHPPLDHPMLITSDTENISASGAFMIYGRAAAAIPNLTTKAKGTLGEVNPTESGDIGTSVVAIVNMSDGSIQRGKFVVVVTNTQGGFRPKELTIHIPAANRINNNNDFDRTFHLEEYARTASHIYYWTSNAMESGLGVEPLWGDSAAGQPVVFQAGLKDADGNNYLLASATALHFRELDTGRLNYSHEGTDTTRPPPERVGDTFTDLETGEEFVVREKRIEGWEFLFSPLTKGDGIYGYTQETKGAGNLVGYMTELSYDMPNEEIRVGMNVLSPNIPILHSVRVWQNDEGRDPLLYPPKDLKCVIKPESETHGAAIKFAGLRQPINDNTNATVGTRSGNVTRNGESIPRVIGFTKGNVNKLLPSDSSNLDTNLGTTNTNSDGVGDWLDGDGVYIDRANSSDQSINAVIPQQNHAGLAARVMGQRIVPEAVGSGTKVRFRRASPLQASDTNLGSYNVNHDCGLYEMELDFAQSNPDPSFFHLAITPADVSAHGSGARLYAFIQRHEASERDPFKRMQMRAGFVFELTSAGSNLMDWNSSGVSNPYVRHKWNFAANQNIRASLSALDGAWYVGFAIMTPNGISSGIHDLIESWIPTEYDKLCLGGTMIPMTTERFEIRPRGTARSTLRARYKTGGYTAAQRELFYGSGIDEEDRDVLVDGESYNINLQNKYGMYHCPAIFNIVSISPTFDNIKVKLLITGDFGINKELLYWHRRRESKPPARFTEATAHAPAPPVHEGEFGISADYQDDDARLNRYLRAEAVYPTQEHRTASEGNAWIIPMARSYPASPATLEFTPIIWRAQMPDEAFYFGGVSAPMVRVHKIEIPSSSTSDGVFLVEIDTRDRISGSLASITGFLIAENLTTDATPDYLTITGGNYVRRLLELDHWGYSKQSVARQWPKHEVLSYMISARVGTSTFLRWSGRGVPYWLRSV